MSKRIAYLPKLDSLRAIAALLVLLSHYFVETGGPDFRYGGNGVQVFFVISGYLITGILLAQKNESEIATPKLISRFIIKRALRLFPVYYVFLLVLVIVSISTGLWLSEQGTLWYYFTYTQNFLFLEKGFQSTVLNHTWSLAVEEQFYILWPFLILLIPRRAELGFLISIFLLGVVSKIYFIDFYYTPGTVKGLTLIHFDTLGAGALLAWCVYYGRQKVLDFFEKYADLLFGIGLLVSGTAFYLGYSDSFAIPLSLTIMSVALVYICACKKKSLLDPLLNLRVLTILGKMSYGLYLFHKPIPVFFGVLWKKTGYAPIENGVILFTIYTALAVGIAVLSWRFFERPILRLKERFDS